MARKAVAKKAKKKSQSAVIQTIIAETLQAYSDGEFELPSILTKYTNPKHPKFKLGLHRETYIPSHRMEYHEPTSANAKQIFRNQASLIVYGLLAESYPIKEGDFPMPLCKECR